MSYLALPDWPMSTLVVNWLVFDEGLAGVEVMSRPLTWRCRASPAAPPAVGVAFHPPQVDRDEFAQVRER